MSWFHNPYSRLAAQVRNGREDAAGELQRELSPKLEWLVRRALRRGDSQSPLGRKVHREAEQFLSGPKETTTLDSEDMVHRVVDRLWAGILDQLQAGKKFSLQGTWWRPDSSPLPADRTVIAC